MLVIVSYYRRTVSYRNVKVNLIYCSGKQHSSRIAIETVPKRLVSVSLPLIELKTGFLRQIANAV